MAEFLFASAAIILLTVTVGLLRVLRGPHDADRLMSAQLIGSGGVAALLLFAVAMDAPAIVDVALMLGLLAAFASVAFVNKASAIEGTGSAGAERR